MKAKSENGITKFYETMPTVYSSKTIGLVPGGFENLPSQIHEAEGFFDVVTPMYDYYTQKLSPIFFDGANKVFTYTVLQLEIPIPKPEPVTPNTLTPTPNRGIPLSKLEFIQRLTPEEFKEILSKSKTDPDMEMWYIMFNLAQYIDVNDLSTIRGMGLLNAKGIIADNRVDEILKCTTCPPPVVLLP